MPTEGLAPRGALPHAHHRRQYLLALLAAVLGGLALGAAALAAEGVLEATPVLAAEAAETPVFPVALALAAVAVAEGTHLPALLVLAVGVELDFLVRAAMAQQEQAAAAEVVAAEVLVAEWAALQAEKTAALADFTVAGLEGEPLMAVEDPECLEQCV